MRLKEKKSPFLSTFLLHHIMLSLFRQAARSRVAMPRMAAPMTKAFKMTPIRQYSDHKEETFEEFTARYVYLENYLND